MNLQINIVGGGWVELELEAHDLNEVAERLRRERGLIGRLVTVNGEETIRGRVFVPTQRVALVSEASW